MSEAAAKKRAKEAKKEATAQRKAATRILSKAEVTERVQQFQRRITTALQVIPIFCAIGFGLFMFAQQPKEMNVPRLSAVPRRTWEDGMSIIGLAERRELMILRNVPELDASRVSSEWTTDYVAAAFAAQSSTKHGVEVYRQPHRAFATFHDGKALQDIVKTQWSDFNSMHIEQPLTVLGLNDSEHKRIAAARATIAASPNANAPESVIVNGFESPAAAQAAGDGDGDFRITADDARQYYYYYSHRYESLPAKLQADAAPFNMFKLGGADKTASQMNFWMGRTGVITHTHYDSMYNFFYQIRGRKRFTLFPPTATTCDATPTTPPLLLYPCLHPHYGHAQSAPSERSNPTYPNQPQPEFGPTGFVADLSAGDLLIVPPFYFHHVETLESSLSINVWSDAPEFVTTEQLYSVPLPFENDWPTNKKVLAAQSYLSSIVEILHAFDRRANATAGSGAGADAIPIAETAPSATEFRSLLDERIAQCGSCVDAFVARYVTSRYLPLVKTGDLSVSGPALSAFRNGHCRSAQSKLRHHAIEMFGQSFARGLTKVIPLLLRLSSFAPIAEDAVSIRSILLANYFEHVSNTMFGAPKVYPFLSSCFRSTLTTTTSAPATDH